MSKFYEKINFSVSKTSMSQRDYPRCKYIIIVVVHMVWIERKFVNPASNGNKRKILGHKIQLIEKMFSGRFFFEKFLCNPLKRQCRKIFLSPIEKTQLFSTQMTHCCDMQQKIFFFHFWSRLQLVFE